MPNLEILVLDDRSTDGTAAVVAHHLADPRVRLIQGDADPPEGWLGKTWACHRLSEHATGTTLIFLDADVVLAPHALAATHGLLSEFDAVSPYPRQVASTWSERLAQPLLQWSWLTFLPLGLAEASPRPSLVAANGQLLAITREAYDEIGGHASVRADVIEDVQLFRELKQVGRRPLIADGTTIAVCHMYDDWPQLRSGYEKSLWAAFGSPAGALVTTAGLGLLYVVPAVAAMRGSRVGAVGYAAGVLGRVLTARRTGGRLWPDAAAHPASIALLMYLTARSLRGRQQGTLVWKERSLPTA